MKRLAAILSMLAFTALAGMNVGTNSISAVRLGTNAVEQLRFGTNLFWASGYPVSALVMKISVGAGETFKIPFYNFGTYAGSVTYGDGGPAKDITSWNDVDGSNTYAMAGAYDVVIAGTFGALSFANGGSKANVLKVSQWGTSPLGSIGLRYGFYGCANLTACADLPAAFSGAMNFQDAWRGCSSLTNPAGMLAMTNTTSVANAWYGCSVLANPPALSGLKEISNISYAWRDCTSMTNAPSVSSLAKVNYMIGAWYGCTAMTSAPSLSAFTNVTSLDKIFVNCVSLKQAPSLSALTNVSIMSYAFYNCASMTTASGILAQSNVVSDLTATWYLCGSLAAIPAMPTHLPELVQCTSMFNGCRSMTGSAPVWWTGAGVPDPAKVPKLVGYSLAYRDCTNLSNYADIPAGWK